MRATLAKALNALATWVTPKAGPPQPPSSGGPVPYGQPGTVDRHRTQRAPTASELFQELKNTAYACANLNASVCASHAPKLYVSTTPGQPSPRVRTKALSRDRRDWLHALSHLEVHTKAAALVEEVTDHPLLTLFRSVNPEHNHWDLWELTTLYQEVSGSCYWLLEEGGFGVPAQIWPLAAHLVRAVRERETSVVDYYEYRGGGRTVRYAPADVVHFKYPDPRDPYGPGLSPLRACYEHQVLDSEYTALKRAKFNNYALPNAVISPAEVIGEEEARRYELEWNAKFGRGGAGRVLVGESPLSVQLLQQSLGDLSALSEVGASREVIASAFGVPVSYMTRETNMANVQAAESQHAVTAIRPRLARRDEKINERLIPLYDPSGRLFVASGEPAPQALARRLEEDAQNVQAGIRTINEVRSQLGLPPVPWGDAPPWLRDQGG